MRRTNRSTLLAVSAILLMIVASAFVAVESFRALMVPDVIVPLPVNVDSDARGVARFLLAESDETVAYRVNVSHIDHITQAHIHQFVGEGRNGPILVWLYPSTDSTAPGAPTGSVDGTLIEGTFGPQNVRNNFTWEQVVEMIRTGQAYVNVHTTEAPGGEINGHIH